jgi:rhamnosyltransferase
MNKSCGLIVTYNPNISVLQQTIASLASSVDKIFLYDNGSDCAEIFLSDIESSTNAIVYKSNKNSGIAEAQNFLLKKAISGGFSYAVMSDQDTTYPNKYFSSLVEYFNDAPKVVAICPGWIDKNMGEHGVYPGQYIFKSNGFLKIDNKTSNVFKIAHAISSGMVIRLSLLEKVGLMRPELFIDWVDNEWCWRVNKLGYTVLSVPSIKVEHILGDETIKILRKNFVVRSNTRNYYIVRNALALLRSKAISRGPKVYLFKKVIQHTLFCFLASNNKRNQLLLLLKAYWHGVIGLLGKMR